MSKAANHSAAPSIVAEGLGHSYGEGAVRTTVLQQLSLQFWPGELALVMGASGSGKSTLLATLSGLLRPQFGTVTSLGTSIWSLKPRELERFRFQHCAFVFQNFNLFPALTALEQVALPLRFAGETEAASKRRAQVALDEVGLSARMTLRPAQLSGGEKQRLAIARAVVTRPTLILADEPTGNIDYAMGLRIMRLFIELNRLGATVLIATHDEGLVKASGMPVLELRQGQLFQRDVSEGAR